VPADVADSAPHVALNGFLLDALERAAIADFAPAVSPDLQFTEHAGARLLYPLDIAPRHYLKTGTPALAAVAKSAPTLNSELPSETRSQC